MGARLRDVEEAESSSTSLCLEMCYQCNTNYALNYFECAGRDCPGPAGDSANPRRRIQLCLECSQGRCSFCISYIQPEDLTSVTNKPTTPRTLSAGDSVLTGQQLEGEALATICVAGQSLQHFNQQLKALADTIQQRTRELKRELSSDTSGHPEISQLIQAGEAVFQSLEREHHPDCTTYQWMISMYARGNDRNKVETWGFRMEESRMWSTDGYNGIIFSFASLPNGLERAHMWFNQMIANGIKADTKSYTLLIQACAKSGDKNRAKMYFERMKEAGIKPNAWTFSHLISSCANGPDTLLTQACAKSGYINRAGMHFERMKQAAIQRNSWTFNHLISCWTFSHFISCCANDAGSSQGLHQAEQFWDEMRQAGEKPLDFTFNCLLKVCAQAGSVSKAEYFYNQMLEAGISPDVVAFTTIIGAFIETGDVRGAEEWFSKMQAAGIKANLATFTCVITVCSKAGDVENAVKWLGNMQEAGFEPSERTFRSLIRTGLSRGDLAEAEKWLMQARNVGIAPSLSTFNILLDSCAQTANVQQAEKWFALMHETGVTPDVQIFNSLLQACANQGFSRWLGLRWRPQTDAERRNQQHWFFKMAELGVQPNQITYAILTRSMFSLPGLVSFAFIIPCVLILRRKLQQNAQATSTV